MKELTVPSGRFTRDLQALTDEEKACVLDLWAAFGAVRHDLWTDEGDNVAYTRVEFLSELKKTGLDDLDIVSLDQLLFKAMTTMGGVDTLKFVLPRFLPPTLRNL
ncbi:MAG: hypothetical protein AAF530_14170 [Pseudomonadota bacterium]